MSAYESLAASYDSLTTDIDYAGILNFLEAVLHRQGRQPKTVLDLACGTGSMSVLLARRGYRVLGADLSEEMLTVAAQKASECENPPYFIRQPMQKLRLPTPVDAVFCLLDSLNYLSDPQDARETIRRVYRNLSEKGIFVFDINTPCKLRGLDGQIFLDEDEERYCLWRAEFDESENRCYYAIDLFQRQGSLWRRSEEHHCEYAYEPSELVKWLKEAGFARVEQLADCRLCPPSDGEQRIYFVAVKE